MTQQGDPKNIRSFGEEAPAPLHETALAEAYRSGYYDSQGNPRSSSNFNHMMMETLFKCNLPKEHDDFEQFLPMIECVIGLLPRVPNYDAATYRQLNRKFADVVDEAHSEGLERVTASDMCKLILRLRSLVPRGDFPLIGLTGVSSIITSRQQSETTVKMPQQDTKSGGFFGFLQRKP